MYIVIHAYKFLQASKSLWKMEMTPEKELGEDPC